MILIYEICFEHLPIEDNKGNIMFADSYGFIHHYSNYKLCNNHKTLLLEIQVADFSFHEDDKDIYDKILNWILEKLHLSDKSLKIG
ncbi:Hypothetical protein SRAE_X000125200 [Strongyloides ratti]|uniref:Uncharacterized protein n=1 Tax=Strongyloides ratti TaxID=34506 RepID=A0A090KUF8_STRRB|nr:Hypothetical protein SRAE_X000125200 [Strongyloides ratti]CEF59505.1 Hypothetical protein SRAE_X000125200 [Strongyloides ratti]